MIPARADHTDPDFSGRDFAHGRGWGLPPLSTAPRFRSAGVAALLTTAHDRPADWINAVQALQRILLTASTCGIAAALHSQPLELDWLRDSIRTQLSDGPTRNWCSGSGQSRPPPACGAHSTTSCPKAAARRSMSVMGERACTVRRPAVRVRRSAQSVWFGAQFGASHYRWLDTACLAR
ncbi:MAG TPA: hypothetical protein VGJ54_08785, partial [Streptosporangiaceae bacterium]